MSLKQEQTHEQIVSQRLKPKEVPDLRKKLLRSQRNICPLCGCIIRPDQAVLDHDHETGRVRRVLHRQCNGAEGRILHWIRRCGVTDPLSFIEALADYWRDDYINNVIHPSFRSKEETEISSLKKKMKKLKTEKGRQRYRNLIQEISEGLDESGDTETAVRVRTRDR